MAPGIAEGPAANGADMLLELAHHTGFDGPVTRIVDAWRDLVDGNLAVSADEQLHAKNADIIQRFGDPAGDPHSLAGDRSGERSGHDRPAQNMILMLVPRRIISEKTAIAAPRGDDGCLERKVYEFLQNRGHALMFRIGAHRFFGASDNSLTFSVIAECARLQDRRPTQGTKSLD